MVADPVQALCLAQVNVPQHRPAKNTVTELGVAEIRPAEVRPAKVRSVHVAEVRLAEVRF